MKKTDISKLVNLFTLTSLKNELMSVISQLETDQLITKQDASDQLFYVVKGMTELEIDLMKSLEETIPNSNKI